MPSKRVQSYQAGGYSVYLEGFTDNRGFVRHGEVVMHYANGQRALLGQYVQGRPSGQWRRWYDNGQLLSDRRYVAGRPHGEHHHWYENGDLARHGHHRDGVPYGELRVYRKGGTLTKKIDFDKGLASKAEYKKNGKIYSYRREAFESIEIDGAPLKMLASKICYVRNDGSYVCKTPRQIWHDLNSILDPEQTLEILEAMNMVYDLKGLDKTKGVLTFCGTSIRATDIRQTGSIAQPASEHRAQVRQGELDDIMSECSAAAIGTNVANGMNPDPNASHDQWVADSVATIDEQVAGCREGSSGMIAEEELDPAPAPEPKSESETAKPVSPPPEVPNGPEGMYGEYGLPRGVIAAEAGVAVGLLVFLVATAVPGAVAVGATAAIASVTVAAGGTASAGTVAATLALGVGAYVAKAVLDDGYEVTASQDLGNGRKKYDHNSTAGAYLIRDELNEVTTSHTPLGGGEVAVVKHYDDGTVVSLTETPRGTTLPGSMTIDFTEKIRREGGSLLPVGEDGMTKCERIQLWWEQKKALCETSKWKTYECQQLLREANNCVDAAEIVPTPDGDFTCPTRRDTTREEAAALDCERKRGVMVSSGFGSVRYPVPGSEVVACVDRSDAPAFRLGDICVDPAAWCLDERTIPDEGDIDVLGRRGVRGGPGRRDAAPRRGGSTLSSERPPASSALLARPSLARVHVRPLDESEFDKVLAESKLPFVVVFSSKNCGPCVRTLDALDDASIAYEGRLRVFSLEVPQSPTIVERYGIAFTPTLISFHGGKVIGHRRVGAARRELLCKYLDRTIHLSGSTASKKDSGSRA